MPQTIASAVGKLKKLRDELADPSSFFIGQLGATVAAEDYRRAAIEDAGKWIGIARQTAHDVLLGAPPPDVDLTEWGLLANYIASRVGMILAPGGDGVVIFLGESQAEFDFASLFGQAKIEASALTLEQVTQYVEAGLRGDPLGKPDITQYDVSRTAQQTAWIVLRKFYVRNFTGDREKKIVEFVMARSITVAEEFFPAILQAWVEIFSVVALRDFAAWAEATAKKILS